MTLRGVRLFVERGLDQATDRVRLILDASFFLARPRTQAVSLDIGEEAIDI